VNDDPLRLAMKAELRDRRRRVRKTMPHEAREARSNAICARIVELPEWQDAKTVMLFVSMRTEVQTGPLFRGHDKRIAVPRMTVDRDEIEPCAFTGELEESGMLFEQPPRNAPSIAGGEIDLVVVPALAIDATGHRIGFGKGFYDRLLPRLPRAVRVGVLFDFETVA
jgi:5-formyltetrahydrofolate cyclo-ligase